MWHDILNVINPYKNIAKALEEEERLKKESQELSSKENKK